MFKTASRSSVSTSLLALAEYAVSPKARRDVVIAGLHEIKMALSQDAKEAVEAMGPIQADSREQVMDGFKKQNPDLTPAQLNEIADQWEKNKDVVKKEAAKRAASPWQAAELADMEAMLSKAGFNPKDAKKLQKEGMGPYELEHRLKEKGGLERTHGLQKKASDKADDDKKSKFEEGKPADPTENMSPEDAKTWKEEHAKNKDQFKSALKKAMQGA